MHHVNSHNISFTVVSALLTHQLQHDCIKYQKIYNIHTTEQKSATLKLVNICTKCQKNTLYIYNINVCMKLINYQIHFDVSKNKQTSCNDNVIYIKGVSLPSSTILAFTIFHTFKWHHTQNVLSPFYFITNNDLQSFKSETKFGCSRSVAKELGYLIRQWLIQLHTLFLPF
jgi:hypothetical protein